MLFDPMKKFLLILIVLFFSVHCFAQNSNSIYTSDKEIGDIKFRTYSYEFSSNEFSKNISFTLPLSNDPKMRLIIESLLHGEYDGETVGQEMAEEYSSYLAEKTADTAPKDDYYETVWKIVPVFVGGGYVAFVSSFSQKFASDIPAPMWGDVASVYELSTGKRMTEEDVFGKNAEQNKAVAQKLYAELKKKASVENTEDAVLFNGNFYFTNKELVFMYGSFEMYHTSGVTKLSLPKKSMKPYLNVDGPLYKYWFGEKK